MTVPKKPKPAAPEVTGNERFLVMDYEIPGDRAKQISSVHRLVYLLPPRAHFEGFGGSRSGIGTGTTPSLIVRDITAHGMRDFETFLADPKTWRTIVEGLRVTIEAPFVAALRELREAATQREWEQTTNSKTAETLTRFAKACEVAAALTKQRPEEDEAG